MMKKIMCKHNVSRPIHFTPSPLAINWITLVAHNFASLQNNSQLFSFTSLLIYGTVVSQEEFIFTLAELGGYIDLQDFENLAIIGDFNVDFLHGGPNAELLKCFMSERHLSAADLAFQQSVLFTYESTDSSHNSWIDHVICDDSMSSSIQDVFYSF